MSFKQLEYVENVLMNGTPGGENPGIIEEAPAMVHNVVREWVQDEMSVTSPEDLLAVDLTQHQIVEGEQDVVVETIENLNNAGWPVILIKEGEKVPADTHFARTTSNLLSRYIALGSTANLGLLTGNGVKNHEDVDAGSKRVPIVCTDADGEFGAEIQAKLEEMHGELPTNTASFQTPSGSIRRLYTLPDGYQGKTLSRKIVAATGGHNEWALLADGLCTVIPPSKLKDGEDYTWLLDHSPQEISLQIAPAWLLEAMGETEPEWIKALRPQKAKKTISLPAGSASEIELAAAGFIKEGSTGRWRLNENRFSRYLVDRFNLWQDKGEAYYRNTSGYLQPNAKIDVQRIARNEINRLIPDKWGIGLENMYWPALKLETPTFDVSVMPEDEINLPNGWLNLSTLELRPHDASTLTMIQLPVAYDPEATCPRFMQFLDEIFEGDQERIDIIQEYMGLSLTPVTKPEKALILYGAGANGKSVLTEVISQLIGNANIARLTLREMQEKYTSANIAGKLAVIATENEFNSSGINTELFKRVVSGESISARRIYGSPFDFKPSAKLILAANQLPYSPDHSTGFTRRILIVPFNRKFEGDECDSSLLPKLLAELPGILLFAVKGYQRLVEQNYIFTESTKCRQEFDEYRDINNPMLVFVNECLEAESGGRITRDSLRNTFDAWCDINHHSGIKKMNNANLFKKIREILRESGTMVEEKRSNGKRYFTNVKIKPQTTDSLSTPGTAGITRTANSGPMYPSAHFGSSHTANSSTENNSLFAAAARANAAEAAAADHGN
ncbi:MAG: phage/plasmid primase, P4 family [bacterium]